MSGSRRSPARGPSFDSSTQARHEGAGRVAGVLQALGERRPASRRGRSRRCRARRGAGGSRPVKIDECEGSVSGTVAVACSNNDALAGQGVDVRRLDAAEAVAAQPVGARRVERDHHDVERGRAPAASRREPRAPRLRCGAGASRTTRRPRRTRRPLRRATTRSGGVPIADSESRLRAPRSTAASSAACRVDASGARSRTTLVHRVERRQIRVFHALGSKSSKIRTTKIAVTGTTRWKFKVLSIRLWWHAGCQI